MMATTVLDSTDLTGILADAGVTLDKTETPPDGDAKPEVKTDPAPADKGTPGVDDADDIEGEDGLTPRQKREFTAAMQKTIGKKHRMQKEAEEFAAAQYNERRLAEQRAEELARENAELRAKVNPPPQAPQAPEKPKRENFANEDEYVDAMIQYGVDERLREKAEADAEAEKKRKYDERINTAAERIQRAVKIVPDYEEVVGGASGDTMLSPAISTYLEESELVAELTYYLAKNPDVLVSLLKLTPHSQLVKIGRIESTLTPFEPKTAPNGDTPSKDTPNGQAKPAPSADTGEAPSKPRGNAAPVITPLDGTGSAGISKDSRDMNIREHIEDYQKKNGLNLNLRKRH
jgi:hypothetical protein